MKELNTIFNNFKNQISQKSSFEKGIEELLHLHQELYPKEVSRRLEDTYEDYIWNNLNDANKALMPYQDEKTIAYYLYHLTRIEDITTNVLILEKNEIFDEGLYQQKINSSIRTTGNELGRNELHDFSLSLNLDFLKEYRIEVGKNTENMINKLDYDDLKRKISPLNLEKILEKNSVDLSQKWLCEYWGNKNVLGILLMPVTRHHLVHLNSCYKIIKKLKGRKND